MSRLEGALREVRGRVEQRRGDLSSQQTQGAVAKALLQARDRGEIEGIYGRLGEWSRNRRTLFGHIPARPAGRT